MLASVFVNTMSYYWPSDCSISSWKRDAWVATNVWKLSKAQVNIGIGYYSQNHTASPRRIAPVIAGEPTWHTLSERCPSLPPDVCVCEGVNFVSKNMNAEIARFVKDEGFRGLFPWAANYDSPDPDESLAVYLGKGLSPT